MSVTIELDDQTAAVLQRLASAQRRTESDILRDAVSAYAQQVPRTLLKGVGMYHSGQSDVSAKARQILREAASDAGSTTFPRCPSP